MSIIQKFVQDAKEDIWAIKNAHYLLYKAVLVKTLKQSGSALLTYPMLAFIEMELDGLYKQHGMKAIPGLITDKLNSLGSSFSVIVKTPEERQADWETSDKEIIDSGYFVPGQVYYVYRDDPGQYTQKENFQIGKAVSATKVRIGEQIFVSPPQVITQTGLDNEMTRTMIAQSNAMGSGEIFGWQHKDD